MYRERNPVAVGEAGHARVAEQFSIESMVSAYTDLYRELQT